MKNFTHKITRFLLVAFIGSIALGAVSCGPSRGYVEQDFGNGLAGGVYYNGGRPGHPAPPPRPPKRHKPKPPKKHKPKPPKKHHDKHHKDKHHDKHHDNHKGHGHRSH